MITPWRILLPLAALLIAPPPINAAITGGSPLLASPPAARVSAEIVADTSAIAAGKPFTAAITLTTFPDWHVYWSNPGETGIATSFKWALPEGFSVEPLPFPFPSKFVQAGDIIGFGYTGKTTFLFKITPPPPPALKDAANLSVSVTWLNCNKDQCVPGSKSLAISLPIGEPNPQRADLFDAARQALPAATPPDAFALAQTIPSGGPERYALHIGWTRAPATVEAFPPDIAGLNLTVLSATSVPGQPREAPLNALSRTLAASTRIDLKSHVLIGQKVTAAKIPVLIVYTLPGDPARKGFYINVDAATLGASPH